MIRQSLPTKRDRAITSAGTTEIAPEQQESPAVGQRLALPWPPSTNNLYWNVPGKGRVPTSEYKTWKRDAGWTLLSQRPVKNTGPVTVTIELCPPTRRRYDLDNKSKSVLDLLVTHGVVKDDSDGFIREVTIRRVVDAAPCTVIVRPAT